MTQMRLRLRLRLKPLRWRNPMDNETGIFGREPALILGLVNAIIAVAVGFGLAISPEQVGLINAAVAALLSVVVRSRVSPV